MQVQKHFSYKEAVRSALTIVWDNFSTFFYVVLIWWIAWAVMFLLGYGLLSSFQTSNSLILSAAYYLFYFFVNLCEPYIQYQILRLGMSFHQGETLNVKQAFSYSFRNFLYFYVARLFLSFQVFVGFILLIVPGFYIGLKHYFAGYSLLENPRITLSNDSAFSSTLTSKVKWRLLLVYVIQSCALITSFLISLLSVVMPPLFLVSVVISTVAILVDLEIFKQLKNMRSFEAN